MFIWSLPVAVISRAASTYHNVSLVPLLSQCGLWYSVHCCIARCRIPLFVLWPYLNLEFLYPACLGVWSVCLGLTSVIFWHSSTLLCHGRFSCDLFVVFPDVLSCFCFDRLAYFCVLDSLFIVAVSVISCRFVTGSCWWWYPQCQWLVDCLSYSRHALLNHVWWFHSWCRCRLILVVSRIGFSSWNLILFDCICAVSTLNNNNVNFCSNRYLPCGGTYDIFIALSRIWLQIAWCLSPTTEVEDSSTLVNSILFEWENISTLEYNSDLPRFCRYNWIFAYTW